MFSTSKMMIALACAAGLGGTALAETFVVRSGGPSARNYPAGRALAANSTISLKAGDMLIVLDSKGTRTLRGPGNFPADGAGAVKTNTSFAQLVSTKGKKRARTGAVRGPDSGPPSLWYVNIERDATMCLAQGVAVSLWRPSAETAATVTVRNEATGASAPVSFAMGNNTVAWPSALPTTEGSRYSLSWAGQAKPVSLGFTGLAANLEDPMSTASALHAKGCQTQYDVLADTLAGADSAAL